MKTDIADLLTPATPMTPDTRITEAGELLLAETHSHLLSLPVVENGRVVGSVNRYQLFNIFLRPFGREIYGNRPVTQIMNPQPLLIPVDQPLEVAAQYVAAHISTPITEDFIITRNDEYLGVGIVLDLLRAMEERVALASASLTKAYEELKASQTQLIQSEKMASLGQMVAGVAHEINTPLGYVRNNVEMIDQAFRQLSSVLGEHEHLIDLMSAEVPDEHRIHAQLLKANEASATLRDAQVVDDSLNLFKDTLFGVDQIKDLVINLRNFSRLDQAKVVDINLNDCLEQTLVIANNVLKNKLEVIRRFGDIPAVSCSPSQINQVLLNLITNAAHAIEHDEGKLLLKTEAEDGWVHLSIQDNGKGIPPENLQKIFDPFFTTKPIGQGTGLGLSISYQIIKAHGGTLRVSSQVGKGSRFTISLPVDAAMLQQAAA